VNGSFHIVEWLLDGLVDFLTDFYIKKHLGNNETQYRRYKVCFSLCVSLVYVKANSPCIILQTINERVFFMGVCKSLWFKLLLGSGCFVVWSSVHVFS